MKKIRQKWLSLSVTVLIGALLIGLTAPAQAIVQARVWDWLARLNRLIPEAELKICQSELDNLPLETDLEGVRSRLNSLNLGLPKEPVELYASIYMLIRKDRILTLMKSKLEQNQQAQRLLHQYKKEIARGLKVLPNGQSSSLTLPEPDYTSIKSADTEQCVTVLRILPKISNNWTKADAHLCLQAANDDLAYLRESAAEENKQISILASNTKAFRCHVRRLSSQLDPNTGKLKQQQDSEFSNLTIPQPPVYLRPLSKE
ncbi:MAG: hypothetical protein ACI376_03180 [Candidatus Bruticola sp.]